MSKHGSFFKDRNVLFYAGDRYTCPVCLSLTEKDGYIDRAGIKKIDYTCPTCDSHYPIIRPTGLPRYRRKL
jgi:hypothetical protein